MKLCKEYNNGYKVNNKLDILKYLKEFENEDREYLIVLGLNTNNKIIYKDIVSIGTLNYCVVSPREIFKFAIIKGCNSIIVAHNHPSGSLEFSSEDHIANDNLKKSGKILDIKLLDFIVFCNNEIKSINEDE